MTHDQIIAWLSTNRAFNVLTRQALDLALHQGDYSSYTLIAFDLDNMKQANTQYGKEKVNQLIRESFRFRSGDLLIGQVYSGDEFAALLKPSDAYGFARRLQDELNARSLSATIVLLDYLSLESGDLAVAKLKDNGIRGIIADFRCIAKP